MKKKVRYAAGIVGAAVPALGLMVPAATAATAHKPAASGKTVTLLRHHQAAAVAGCTGTTKVVKTNSINSTLRFYWTPEFTGTSNAACIGTVEGFTADGLVTAASDWRIRIYGHNRSGKKEMEYSHRIQAPEPGLMENSHSFTDPVHNVYGALPVQVCMAPIGPNVPKGVPPTCRSVN
jgi:hypothetical protein